MGKIYLRNEQINLRAVEPEDLELMYQIENNPGLWEVGSTTVPYSRYVLKQYIEKSQCDIFADRQLRLIIEQNQDKRILGSIDLTDFDPLHNRAAIGIVILEEFHHTGIARQTLNLLCEYSFDFLHLKQLYAYISIDNTASIALFTSCGFFQSGTLKAWIQTYDGYKDALFVQKVKN